MATRRIRAIEFAAVLGCMAIATACTSARSTPSPTPAPTQTVSPAAGDLGQSPRVTDCCAPPTRPPYALVTARPTRTPVQGVSPAPSVTPTPTPALTANTALDQDATGYFTRTVPAHVSVSIPIGFEGSSWGSIGGFVGGSAIVTFAGKPLELQQSALLGNGFSFSTSTDNPVDGTLVIKNQTGSAVEAGGWVMIETTRHLVAAASTNFPKRTQPVTFDVVLSDASESDGVVASSSSEKQTTPIPIAMTRVGPGHWVGSATFDTSGDYEVRFQTTGARMRTGMVALTVAAGGVTVGSGVTVGNGFDTQIDDSDRDGYINSLVLSPTVTTIDAGQYLVRGVLYDASGTNVAESSTGEQALVAGSQKVALTFAGEDIYKAQRWGPYTLRVTVERFNLTTIELDDQAVGETETYDYMQFQHDPIAFDPRSFKSQAYDTDGDGLFEELVFSGTVSVEEPGLYEINTSLYADNPWDHVAMAEAKVHLTAGPNTFKLVFSGADIAKAGRDGPYVEAGLLCYLESDPTGGLHEDSPNYTTSAYAASQFGP